MAAALLNARDRGGRTTDEAGEGEDVIDEDDEDDETGEEAGTAVADTPKPTKKPA